LAADVVLFNEHAEVTETIIANIVIYKDGRWVPPPVHCELLSGTLHQSLLASGRIVEPVIRGADLPPETPFYLINSVCGWRWAQLKMS
jgi:para-aminobenzoate synthetase/4-amino-4-deoxychorismate lyase